MATLEGLPAELIILIAGHVKTSGLALAHLALISREWQTQIESIIFSKRSIRASDLQEYSLILTHTRFLALRELDYRIDDVLPGEPNDTTSVRISAESCAMYSDTFTWSIRNSFTMLKAKCDDFDVRASHPGIALSLISSPFVGKGSLYLKHDREGDSQDAIGDSGEESDAVQYSQDSDGDGSDDAKCDEYGPEWKLTRAWLRLTGDALPIVPIVTRLTNDDRPDPRQRRLFQMIWPPSWSAIASCLPNVKATDIYVCDNERRDRQGRRAARDGFGRSLQTLPLSVANVNLIYSAPAPSNQFRRSLPLTDNIHGYDIFSHELGLFSQRLVSLVLQDATINFVDFFACSATSDWPFLQKLDIRQAQPSSTDGTWYFRMNPGEPRERYSRNAIRSLRTIWTWTTAENELPAMIDRPLELFRTSIVPAKFKEIYTAAAKAVKRMRKLLTLPITFELQGDYGGPGTHEFFYEAGHPRDSVILSKSSSADIKLEWTMIPSVEIGETVLAAWREIAADRGSTIEFYIIDNPENLYDDRLIE